MSLLRGASTHSQVIWWSCSPETQTRVYTWNLNANNDTLPAYTSLTIDSTLTKDLCCAGHSGLPDGRLMVTGGTDQNSAYGINSVLLYTPTTRYWDSTAVDTMMSPRWYLTNVSMQDSTIMVFAGDEYSMIVGFGGESSTGGTVYNDMHGVLKGLRQPWPVTEFADPSTSPPARKEHSAIFDFNFDDEALRNMVIFGGRNNATPTPGYYNDVWAWGRNDSLLQYTWTQLSPSGDATYGFPTARARHTAVYDPSGPRMFIYGGQAADGTVLSDVWRLTLRPTRQWTKISVGGTDQPSARYGHTAAWDAKGNGRMLMFGGRNAAGWAGTGNDIWQLVINNMLATATWSKVTTSGTAPSARDGHIMVLRQSTGSQADSLYIFGGQDADSLRSDLGLLHIPASGNPDWNAISTTTRPLPRTQLADVYQQTDPLEHGNTDRLIIYGGRAGAGYQSDLWMFSLGITPTTSDWILLRPGVVGPRAGHTMIYDNREVVACRPERSSKHTHYTWNRAPAEAGKTQLTYPAMFMLPTGNVFFAGRTYDSQVYAYDAATQTWAWGTTTMSTNVRGGTAVMYTPGTVMKCGFDGVSTQQLTDYTGVRWIALSSDVGTWQSAADMDSSRTQHNLTLLPSGNVLLTGGTARFGSVDSARTSAEIWRVNTHDWLRNLAINPFLRDYHSTEVETAQSRRCLGHAPPPQASTC
jgi:hypothetical protein